MKKLRLLKLVPSLLVIAAAGLLTVIPSVSMPRSGSGVLAYATNTTRTGLLSATNVQRSNNGAGALSLNSKLNTAAQNKANDMVNRGYWAHETPDGEQPWIFFAAAGYSYLAAGENLAYGYATSSSTVTGWMNSPPHKSNLISGNYTEVGFGIANTPDYCYVGDHDSNSSTPDAMGCVGPQTIVVAMYGKPQVASANTAAPTAEPTAPKQTPQSTQPQTNQPKPTEVVEKPVEEETIAVEKNDENDDTEIVTAAAPTKTSRIQMLTNGSAAWSATAVILTVCSIGLLWAIHKGIHVKKYVLAGEHFLARHVYLDLFVVSVVILGFVLLSTTGAIK